MDKKQQNVRQAKTLSEYANIAFPRDKTVCMLFLFGLFFSRFGAPTRVWSFQLEMYDLFKTKFIHKHTYASADLGEIVAGMKWNKTQKMNNGKYESSVK